VNRNINRRIAALLALNGDLAVNYRQEASLLAGIG